MVISGDERWPPVVVVVLWRRLLGVLGDVNAIEDARLHEMVFQYLVELLDIFLKVRQLFAKIATSDQFATNLMLLCSVLLIAGDCGSISGKIILKTEKWRMMPVL